MSIRISQIESEKRVNNRLNDISVSLREPFVYTKAISTILKLKCNVDGTEWDADYNRFVNSKIGCKICAIKKNSDRLRTPQKEVDEKVKIRLKEINASLTELFIFKNTKSRLKLKCNIDGHEWVRDYHGVINLKTGCPRCDGQVIYQEEAQERVNNRLKKINASLKVPFIYKNNYSRPSLICNKKGHEWNPTYHEFIHGGNGCPKCAGRDLSKKEINEKVNSALKDINASLIEPFIYTNNESILKLKCNIDGHEWDIRYYNLINRKGCAKCAGVLKYTQKEAYQIVSKKCKLMNYELLESFEYITTIETKIKLKCKKCDHVWDISFANLHYNRSGCPHCNISKGEKEIEKILIKQNILFIPQKTFKGCKDKGLLKFDFYLPKLNTCIEFDGIQHFKSFKFFGGVKRFKQTQKKDAIKNKYCKDSNIKLIRIPYTKFNEIETILSNIV